MRNDNDLNARASSATAPNRFITAFANGNTGALVYFIPAGDNSTSLGTTLEEGSLASYQADYNQTGLQGNIVVSSNLTFGVTLSECESARKCGKLSIQLGAFGP